MTESTHGTKIDTMDKVLKASQKKVLFTRHALNMMNSAERMVSKDEVAEVIAHGKLITDYHDDPRGHSCLLQGKTRTGRTIHVVCALKDDYLAIITVYIPYNVKSGRR